MSAATFRRFSLLLLTSFLSGCATAPPAAVPAVPPDSIALRFEQLPTSDLVVEQRGAVSVAYQLMVRNPFPHPLRMTKLEMKTVGRSPYILRDEALLLDQAIEAGQETTVAFSMWAIRRAKSGSRAEPVWVQGTATFEGPNGTIRKTFSQSFAEPD